MIDYEYYFDQYRRVPRNSATTNRDLIEFQSTATYSSYASWARSSRRPLTTTYIDGSTFFGIDHRPMTTKGLFPKGKGRRKPSATVEKRLNLVDPFMSLVPSDRNSIEALTGRSEKIRSPLSMTTTTLMSQQRVPSARKTNDTTRLSSAQVYQIDPHQPKIVSRCPSASRDAAWVRRYKSMNESHTLNEFLREHSFQDRAFLKKRSCPQLALISSSSSASSLNKRQRAKC